MVAIGRTSWRHRAGKRLAPASLPAALIGFLAGAATVLCPIPPATDAAPLVTGGREPKSYSETVQQLRVSAGPPLAGFYAVESRFTFNVLDSVSYDPTSGGVSFVGHLDPRFDGPPIPYLQHLATLLDLPPGKLEPRFSLNTDQASRRTMQAKVASAAFTRSAMLAPFAQAFDSQGVVTWFGRPLLLSLGLSPIQGHRLPGFLGATVEQPSPGKVRIVSIVGGSPADAAGLLPGDEITRFNGRAPSSTGDFDRLVRFAGSGSQVSISYVRNGHAADASSTLAPDGNRDPWWRATQFDVAALLPAASQGKPTVERLKDFAANDPAGVQLPPELVEGLVGAHHESVPEYGGISPNSQLARLLFDVDYSVIKRLPHRVDLKQRLPGYQTLFDWAASHPQIQQSMAGYRIWISVAKMEVAQSRSGTTLVMRDAALRFNFVRETADGRDVATGNPSPAQGYANVLTPLYDELAREYPALHELREVAKLAAAAAWIRTKTPGFRLPAAGRVSWTGPLRVPGLTFLQTPRAGSDDIWLVPHGGINLTPFYWQGPPVIPTDERAPELSGRCPAGLPPSQGRCVGAIPTPPSRDTTIGPVPPKKCPPGTSLQGGGCVRQTTIGPVPPKRCPWGSYLQGTVCVKETYVRPELSKQEKLIELRREAREEQLALNFAGLEVCWDGVWAVLGAKTEGPSVSFGRIADILRHAREHNGQVPPAEQREDAAAEDSAGEVFEHAKRFLEIQAEIEALTGERAAAQRKLEERLKRLYVRLPNDSYTVNISREAAPGQNYIPDDVTSVPPAKQLPLVDTRPFPIDGRPPSDFPDRR